MRHLAIRRSLILPAIAVTGLAVGVGVAYSSIPDADERINGCYAISTGQLRVIDTDGGASCRSNEVAISWAQDGGEGGLTEVRSENIVDGEVKTADLAEDAVTSEKLADEYGLLSDLQSEAAARSLADAQLSADLENEAATRASYNSGLATTGGGPVHFDNITNVQIGGSEVTDASLAAGDLADGAVLTSKQTANSAIGGAGPATVLPSTSTTVATTILTLPESAPGHVVLLGGQTQISCASCFPSPGVVVVQVFRDGLAVSSPIEVTLTGGTPVHVPVFGLATEQWGTASYELVVTHEGAEEFVAEGNTLVAVDLGQ